MKSILSALGAALRGVFAVAKGVVMFPFNLLSSVLGGPLVGPPAGDSPMVEHLKEKIRASHAETVAEAAERMAKIVSNWAMDCIIEDRIVTPPGPPRVSRPVADWLPGLTRDECMALVGEQIPAISKHISGDTPIEGLRPVSRLCAEPWPPETPASKWDTEVEEPDFTPHGGLVPAGR